MPHKIAAISHWYSIDGVLITDLMNVCGSQPGRIVNGKLLMMFDSRAHVRKFEQDCRDHRHVAVQKIARLPANNDTKHGKTASVSAEKVAEI